MAQDHPNNRYHQWLITEDASDEQSRQWKHRAFQSVYNTVLLIGVLGQGQIF